MGRDKLEDLRRYKAAHRRDPDPSRWAERHRLCELPRCGQRLEPPAWQKRRQLRPNHRYCCDAHRIEHWQQKRQAQLRKAEGE